MKQATPTTKTVLLAKSTSENGQDITLMGSIWRVHLQVARTSRNDPAFTVESLGGRGRIITVSVHVLSDDNSLQAMAGGYIPDAVYALASAALVNEAFVKDQVHDIDDSVFANAVTEVLLQFSAAARPTIVPT
ncbi:MAG: hypothetical protein JHC62_01745 [Microbacteriaceae bacterium]|nr:hypothetical protein [Microbacteriaceae bacterium]